MNIKTPHSCSYVMYVYLSSKGVACSAFKLMLPPVLVPIFLWDALYLSKVVPNLLTGRKGGLCEESSEKTDDEVWTVHFGPVRDNLQYM